MRYAKEGLPVTKHTGRRKTSFPLSAPTLIPWIQGSRVHPIDVLDILDVFTPVLPHNSVLVPIKSRLASDVCIQGAEPT